MPKYTLSECITVAQKLSAANQIRALKTSSANQNRRQPIGVECYLTRELSARLEDPTRFSAPLSSL